MNLYRVIRLSRPRFWIYELGTYALGVCAGLSSFEDADLLTILFFGLFFLFPANLLIYGINDIFDYETDKLNPKKTGYEDLLVPELHNKVFLYIILSNIAFIIASLFTSQYVFFSLFLFYFFAIFYSTPPIRAKARPYFDSLFSAGHYVVTGVFGYYLVGGTGNITLSVVAGMCWAIAMHAYSAVPDIEADRESGIETIAIRLGKQKTILLCAFLYACAASLVYGYLSYFSVLLVLPYLVLMYLSYRSDTEKLFKLYTYFPKINSLVGMILFFIALFRVL